MVPRLEVTGRQFYYFFANGPQYSDSLINSTGPLSLCSSNLDCMSVKNFFTKFKSIIETLTATFRILLEMYH